MLPNLTGTAKRNLDTAVYTVQKRINVNVNRDKHAPEEPTYKDCGPKPMTNEEDEHTAMQKDPNFRAAMNRYRHCWGDNNNKKAIW